MTDLKCTMGCPNLDNMMGGGISCGLITELVGADAAVCPRTSLLVSTSSVSLSTLTCRSCASTGEATAGKTQTCLQLLLSVQWPTSRGGLEGSAL